MNNGKVAQLATSVCDFHIDGCLVTGEGTWTFTFSEDQLMRFARSIIDECIVPVRELCDRVERTGMPIGYDGDSYILGANDAILEIEERFGIDEE